MKLLLLLCTTLLCLSCTQDEPIKPDSPIEKPSNADIENDDIAAIEDIIIDEKKRNGEKS